MGDPIGDLLRPVEQLFTGERDPITGKKKKRPVEPVIKPPRLAKEGAIKAENVRRRQSKKQGRASTILASSDQSGVASKTLLGQ